MKLTKKMTAGILSLALATPVIANNNPSTADEQHEFVTIQSEIDSEQFNKLSQDKFVGANMQLLFDQSDRPVQLAELSQVEMSQTQGAFFNWGQIFNTTVISGNTAVQNVTTVLTSVVSNAAASGRVYRINSLIIANVDGVNAADVTVDLFRSSIAYRLASTITVPADASLVVISKENL